MNNAVLKQKACIYVAGHNGLVGSAIIRHLKQLGYNNIITRSHAELDLTNQADVKAFFANNKVDQVILAAAKVGGIFANDEYPAEFIYENLMIESNVIHQAYSHGVHRLLFLGSSCIYPKLAEQPMQESALLAGYLEPTNEPYAIAKIAGIKLCESYNRQYGTQYRSVMPTNLYGPNDDYHPTNSHVIPALIRRIHEAKTAGDERVVIWGTGKARREFMYVDDMASASVFIMLASDDDIKKTTQSRLTHINIGVGEDTTIHDLALLIAKVIGYQGALDFDTSKPDGTPRKLLDTTCLYKLGWRAKTNLEHGLKEAYAAYLSCQQPDIK